MSAIDLVSALACNDCAGITDADIERACAEMEISREHFGELVAGVRHRMGIPRIDNRATCRTVFRPKSGNAAHLSYH